MSLTATRWAAPIEGIPMTAKLMLLVLADHADDDGKCWPAVPRLARRCCMSERAAQGAIKALVTAELVTLSGVNGGRRLFALALSTPAASAPVTPAADAPPPQGVPGSGASTPAAGAGTPADAAPTPAASAPEPTIEPTIEPVELPSVAARATREPRGTRLDREWKPSPDDRAYAIGLGLPVDRVAENFRGFWLAKAGAGARKIDWSLTWQGWCRRDADRITPASRGPPPATRRAATNGAIELALRSAERSPQRYDDDVSSLPLLTGAA